MQLHSEHTRSPQHEPHTHNHPPGPQNTQNKKREEKNKPNQKNKKKPTTQHRSYQTVGFFLKKFPTVYLFLPCHLISPSFKWKRHGFFSEVWLPSTERKIAHMEIRTACSLKSCKIQHYIERNAIEELSCKTMVHAVPKFTRDTSTPPPWIQN